MGCREAPSRRVSFSLLCHRATQAAPGPRSEWETSLQEEFLGPSHCCPIPWIPPDNKVEGWAGPPAVWGVCPVCPHHLAHLLFCAGHPNMGGSMQRMNPPRGMGPMGPGPQNYGSGMRPPPNSLGPAMPGINMGPGAGRPWPNPNSANSIPYSSSSPGTYVGPPGGGGPPGTPIMPSPADSTNSSDNIYTMINPVPPGGSRSNFPMGPGSDGPMGGMGGMEPHHMNGSLGSGDIDGLPKVSVFCFLPDSIHPAPARKPQKACLPIGWADCWGAGAHLLSPLSRILLTT
uniref:Single stranded DNA binding protein 3 n=1 Tax=Ursus maritimus TaxID=29073 RepID=A0A452VB73_URSMA